MDDIRVYLRDGISSAIQKTFPNCRFTPQDIVIRSPRHRAHGDIATAFPLKFAHENSLPVTVVGNAILNVFSSDNRFIESVSNIEESLHGGFLNFKFSNLYLAHALKHCSENNFVFEKVVQPVKIQQRIIQISSQILDHASNRGFTNSQISTTNLLLPLTDNEEVLVCNIARTVALSTTVFFPDLVEAFQSFYNNCPIFTNVLQVTLNRLQIVLAVKNIFGKAIT